MKKFTVEHRERLSKALKGKYTGPKSPLFKDEVGNKYQMLTVKEYKGQKRGRGSMWLCECECGGECIVDGAHLRNGHSKSCGCLLTRKGKDHPAWKGGSFISNGYSYIYKPGHPNTTRANMGRYVGEHTYVMAKHIGRPLFKNEIVHHKNGIKTDNRIKNLELCLREDHLPGQSVKDKIKYAIEIINKYKPEMFTLCRECHQRHTETESDNRLLKSDSIKTDTTI